MDRAIGSQIQSVWEDNTKLAVVLLCVLLLVWIRQNCVCKGNPLVDAKDSVKKLLS